MPKCDLCLYKLDCVLTVEECAITAIDDDKDVGDEMPHPTEIEFNLKAQFAKFIGNQLLVWIDEKSLRALASMRPIEVYDEKEGFDGPPIAYLMPDKKPSICFLVQTPEEADAQLRSRGYKTSVCVCGLKASYINPKDEKCCHCGEPLTFT